MTTETKIEKQINTPRWGIVTVTRIFKSRMEASMNGFNEPTGTPYIRGKLIDSYADENGHGWSKFEWGLIQED